MEVFITGLHITLCFFLILVVLLQPGKGADFGAAMGGSSSSDMFGATGSVTILTKLTAIVAALFMITSLSLAWFSNTAGGAPDLDPEELRKEAALDSQGNQVMVPVKDGGTPVIPEVTPDEAAPEDSTGTESEAVPPEGGEVEAPEGGEAEAPEAGEAEAPEAGEAGAPGAGEAEAPEAGEAEAPEGGESPAEGGGDTDPGPTGEAEPTGDAGSE